MTDILQETYHKLQEWIMMLNADWGKDTDAEYIRQEMIEHCGKIWNSKYPIINPSFCKFCEAKEENPTHKE